jgi:hypothetical protein
MIITKEWLNKHRSKSGGYTKKQLNAIGVSWPPVKGWVDKVIGNEIDEDNRRIFEGRRA